MKKIIMFMILVGLNFNGVTVFADEVTIVKQDISDAPLGIYGEIPCMKGFYKKYVQEDINHKIEDIYIEKILLNLDQLLYFSSLYKEYEDISSIILYTTIGYDPVEYEVDTINFNNKTGAIVNLQDLIGVDNDFVGLTSNFYVEDGEIILLFNSY